MSSRDRWHQLMADYLGGEISPEDFAELEALLRESADARKLFHQLCRVAEQLQQKAEDLDLPGNEEPKSSPGVTIPHWELRISWLSAGLAAALVMLLALVSYSWTQRPRVIATILASENAAWESPLPTSPGSQLTAGPMRLTSGISTLRFRSGAEMTIEAPARLVLQTPMKTQLESGTVVLQIPPSATGYILETPYGQVIDHGTAFAASVRDEGRLTTVEVIEGKVSLLHPSSGQQFMLAKQEAGAILPDRLERFEGPAGLDQWEDLRTESKVLRVYTGGQSTSVMRANKEKWMHPDKLMVKRRKQPTNHERRSFFSFDLAEVNLDEVQSVQLRLNQVPSGIGYASQLREISRIAVYGVTNQERVDWTTSATWESAPTTEDGVLLGHLEIPRSDQRGSRFFQSPELLPFLEAQKTQGNAKVTFLLDGSLDPDTGDHVPSLVLAFASDENPEAPGPMLEFTLKE